MAGGGSPTFLSSCCFGFGPALVGTTMKGRRRRRRRAVERLRTGFPLPPRALLSGTSTTPSGTTRTRGCATSAGGTGTPTNISYLCRERTRCWAGVARCALLRKRASCWWIDVAYRRELRCARFLSSRCSSSPLTHPASTQRSHFPRISASARPSLTAERIQKLNDVGFDWTVVEQRKVPWESRYRELEQFVVRERQSVSQSVSLVRSYVAPMPGPHVHFERTLQVPSCFSSRGISASLTIPHNSDGTGTARFPWGGRRTGRSRRGCQPRYVLSFRMSRVLVRCSARSTNP
jgi:hypothetical protein